MYRDMLVTRRTAVILAGTLVTGCVGDDADGASDGTGAEDGAGGDGGTSGDDADGIADDGEAEGSPDEEADGEETEGDAQDDTNGNPATGEVTQMGELTLTSPEFEHGEQIPERYGYEAENVNPPLSIDGVPEDAESLALIVDDPDAVEPAGKVWDHWIVWNIPPETTEIPEGWEPSDADEGTNDYGEVGYGGPNPPDREHRYRFKLFALDATLDLPPETDAETLGEALEGNVLARTQLDGTYPA